MSKLLFLLLFPVFVQAQSISISPGSIVGLAKTHQIHEAGLQYRSLAVVAIVKSDLQYHFRDIYFGILFAPDVRLDSFSASPILAVFRRPFLSEYGTRLNFGLKISRDINRTISLYFRHLSNAGMGANPGVDSIGISVSI